MIEIQTIETGIPTKAIARALKAAAREGYRTAVVHWHDKFRPLHFQNIAYVRYGYAKRDKKYQDRKRKKFGHTLPLTYTGTGEAMTRARRVVMKKDSAAVRMNAPVFNFMNKFKSVWSRAENRFVTRKTGPSMNMREELLRINAQETKSLTLIVQRQMKTELKNANTKARITTT